MNDEHDPTMDTASETESEGVTVSARDALKWVAKTIVAGSVGTTISLMVKQNVTPKKKRQKYAIHIGAWALGGMIGDMTEPHIEAKVDDYIEMGQKAKKFADKLKNKK